MIDGEQSSEFWNRDDDASGSDEDISDSDGILFLSSFFLLGWGECHTFSLLSHSFSP